MLGYQENICEIIAAFSAKMLEKLPRKKENFRQKMLGYQENICEIIAVFSAKMLEKLSRKKDNFR